MRAAPDENIHDWAEKVHDFEMQLAKNKIAKGIAINIVIAEMSQNIVKKLMHPIFNAIRKAPQNT